MRSAPYVLFFAVSAGILINIHLSGNFVLILPILTFFALVYRLRFLKRIRENILLLIICALLFFVIGAFRMYRVESNPAKHQYDAFLNKKVNINGVIIREPDERDSQTLLTVKVEDIGPGHSQYQLNILVLAAPGPSLNYGDRILIEGKLIVPKIFLTDAGKVFDYVHYLAKDDIFYEIKHPDIKVISHNNGNFFVSRALSIKKVFVQKINNVIPFPQSALLDGMLFGTKRSLGQNLLSAFQVSGVIHMVVVSGYNISIISNAVSVALSSFPKIIAFVGGSSSILFFILMTGFSASSIRAAIMTFIALAGILFKRNYDPLRTLFLSGLAMILWNPLMLLYDPSFQLSFLATFGIIILPKKIEPFLTWIPHSFGLKEIVIMTLSSEIILTPFLLYINGNFSLFALPVNVLVLFPVSMTMFFGFLTGLLGHINMYFSVPSAFISFVLLSYEIQVVTWFSKLPFASIQMTISLWLMTVTYLFYTLVFFIIKIKTPVKVF